MNNSRKRPFKIKKPSASDSATSAKQEILELNLPPTVNSLQIHPDALLQVGVGTVYNISPEEHAALHRFWGMPEMNNVVTEAEFIVQATLYAKSTTPYVRTKAEMERYEKLAEYVKNFDKNPPLSVDIPKSKRKMTNQDKKKREEERLLFEQKMIALAEYLNLDGHGVGDDGDVKENCTESEEAAATAEAPPTPYKPSISDLIARATAIRPAVTLVDFIKVLIDKKINLNKTFDNGETMLIVAIFEKNAEAVKLLVENGASVHARNRFDQTALMLATKSGVSEIVEALLEGGAAVDERSES